MNIHYFKAIAMALVCIATVEASVYPKIDAATPWSVSNWSGGSLRGLAKRVLTGSGTYDYYDKNAFYEMALEGIKIDGTYYGLTDYSQVISQTCTTSGTDVSCYGTFGFVPLPDSPYPPDNPNFQYKVTYTVHLEANGKFDYGVTLLRPTLTGGQTKDMTAYVKLDYDFETASDNIFEFTWGNQVDNPPAATSPLSYSQPSGNSWSNYWGAVSNEVTVQYPATFTDYDAIAGWTPMRRPIFRALYSATAPTQFGANFWTLFESQTTRANIDITTKGYAYNPSVPWSVSTGTNFQTTSNIPPYPRYAHSGNDLMTEVVVRKTDANNTSVLGLQGKLFQRPNERPLEIIVKYHANVGSWVNSPTGNIFNQTIRTVSSENRSLRTGINRLVANENLFTEASTMPMYSGYSDGSSIDRSGLHNMIANCLSCKESPSRTMSSWSYEANAWIVHAWITNWTFSEAYALGIMFDGIGITRMDGAAREGAAIFWPTILAAQGNNTTNAALQTSLVALHEIGHTFGINHYWSSCKTASGSGGACVSTGIADAMSTYAQNATPANTVRFNEDDPSAGNNWEDRNLARYYKYGPESWVKPGRNSSWLRDTPFMIPNYTTY